MSLSFQERFRDRVGAMGRQGELEVAGSTPIHKPAAPSHSTSLQASGVSVLQTGHQGLPTLPFPSMPQNNSPEFQFARPIKVQRNSELMKQYETVSVPRLTPVASSLLESGLSLQASEVQSLQDFRQFRQKMAAVESQQKPPVEGLPHMKSVSIPVQRSANPQRSPAPPKPPPDKKSLSANTVAKSQAERLAEGFSPYTLKDYRLIRPLSYVQLGGLGPFMIGTEDWQRKKELFDRRKNYAKQVLASNMSHFAELGLQPRLEKAESGSNNSRQRALDFSRNIRPPIAKFEKTTVVVGQREETKDDYDWS